MTCLYLHTQFFFSNLSLFCHLLLSLLSLTLMWLEWTSSELMWGTHLTVFRNDYLVNYSMTWILACRPRAAGIEKTISAPWTFEYTKILVEKRLPALKPFFLALCPWIALLMAFSNNLGYYHLITISWKCLGEQSFQMSTLQLFILKQFTRPLGQNWAQGLCNCSDYWHPTMHCIKRHHTFPPFLPGGQL